ncbi:MAG TPA: hypothetical protein VGN17_29040 [Bryobacteraceae bacterium]
MHLKVAVLLFAALPALAQSHAYVYIAPGLQSANGSTFGDALLHLGGGGEFVMKNGIGVGADGGVLGVIFGDTLGTVSVDGFYHFPTNASSILTSSEAIRDSSTAASKASSASPSTSPPGISAISAAA